MASALVSVFNLLFVAGMLCMMALAFGWGWVAAGAALLFAAAVYRGLRN